MSSLPVSNDSLQIFSIVLRKEDFTFVIQTSGWLITLLIVIFVSILIIRYWFTSGKYELDEAEFGIGSQKVRFKSNFSNLQIAYKMWVELSTRKVGLEVDPNRDVIAEVYDSWYRFFEVMRELLKEIPAQTLKRDKSARDIVTIAAKIINEELRPHLTTWQAHFRRWYDLALQDESNKSKKPQEIQKEFPEFSLLTDDIRRINNILVAYRRNLEKIVLSGKSLTLWAERKKGSITPS